MITHFYSDPHFGHPQILEYADRPFENATHMDECLIDNYNGVVDEDDHVLWLGDCGWDMANLLNCANSMNGRKTLILGNHDRSGIRMARMRCWDMVISTSVQMNIAGVPILANHYPPKGATYPGMQFDKKFKDVMPPNLKERIVVHGHTHEKTATVDRQRRIHVGVDAWDYSPVSTIDIRDLIVEMGWDKKMGLIK